MDADDDECERALRELFGSLPPLAHDAPTLPTLLSDAPPLPPLGDFDLADARDALLAPDAPAALAPPPPPQQQQPQPQPLPQAPATPQPSPPPPPPPPPPQASSAARALRARPVLYKSRQLSRVAPALVASAPSSLLCAATSIRAANRVAESVREQFKREREQQIVQAQPLASDASNADKYERRLKMNRWSAAASRVRRDAYTKALEAELVKMERAFRAVVSRLQRDGEGAATDGDADAARGAGGGAGGGAETRDEMDGLDEWLRYVHGEEDEPQQQQPLHPPS